MPWFQHKNSPSHNALRALLYGVSWLALTATAWLAATAAPQDKPAEFWAFRAVREPASPPVSNHSWLKNPLDAFVLAKLEAQGLSPAPPADKATLLRRLTFDLTGLPPTPQETEDFLADNSPNALEKVIDRLLASPRYGERWARHWLDVARYTDSLDKRDTDTIRDINDIWRYRDWVVRALNQDLPYTEFILAQIAGDLLPSRTNPQEPDLETTIATGFLAVGNWGNGDADKVKMLANIADDQIDAVGRGFMGLTLSCARCHDHKFDPLSTQDYYGLAGIFLSSHILPRPAPNDAMDTPLRIPLLTTAERTARAEYATNLAQAKRNLAQVSEAPLRAFAQLQRKETARTLTALWDYAHRPQEQANRSLEAFAESRKLLPYALRQWRDYFAIGGYRLLSTPRKNIDGFASIYGWKGEDEETPAITVNANNTPRELGSLAMPPFSSALHPGKQGVVVSWRSPIAGVMQVRGALAGADKSDKGETDWALDVRTLAGARTLTTGRSAFGRETAFAGGEGGFNLTSVPVKVGDCIQLTLFPRPDSANAATLIVFEIGERGSERLWRLTQDIVETVLEGNPHKDKQGNPEVWGFYGGAESHRFQTRNRALQTALSQWEKAFRTQKDRAALEASAQDFQNVFAFNDASSPFWITEREDWKHLPMDSQTVLKRAAQSVDTLLKNAPPPIQYANGAQEGGCPRSPYAGVHDARIHKRGNHLNLGEVVPRGFPKVIRGEKPPSIPAKESGRLQLAEWLTRPEHPLTARVLVNRVWSHHFGQGIVRTPNNFGLLGERPTHPELLDWLAAQFVKQGWSLKKLHKLILLSATYQQSAVASAAALAKDPDNRLLGRMSRKRLEAEAIRDSLLAVGGRLNVTMGGVGEKDFRTPRRTLYLMSVRSERTGFCPLFDGADPTSIVEKRTVSTVAPQSLYLLNSDFMVEQAKALQERMERESPKETDGRIVWLYRLLFGREPTAGEAQVGRAFVKTTGRETWQDYAHLLLCTNEFITLD